MSTANPNKLKIKDIITVVLLALINVVIFFASSVLYLSLIHIFPLSLRTGCGISGFRSIGKLRPSSVCCCV